MNRSSNYLNRGFTLIEILLVLGIVFIIVSLAIPSVSSASTRADMRAAGENLEYSIRIARNTARMEESVISMSLLDEADGASQRITFSSPELPDTRLGNMGIQEYQFSKEIRFVSDFPSYEFDSRGIVQNPGMITLTSRADDSVSMQIRVE